MKFEVKNTKQAIKFDNETLEKLKEAFKKAYRQIKQDMIIEPDMPERFYPSDSEIIYIVDDDEEDMDIE